MRFALALLALSLFPAGVQAASSHARVSVQPVTGFGPEGSRGPSALRSYVAKLVRGHGYRVLTSLPAVSGTGQYPSLARDHRVAVFVTAELDEQRRRHRVVFVVWHGLAGEVAGRWAVSAPPKKFYREIGKSFWKRLGRAIDSAQLPPDTRLPPARPMRIDASSPYDEPVEPQRDAPSAGGRTARTRQGS